MIVSYAIFLYCCVRIWYLTYYHDVFLSRLIFMIFLSRLTCFRSVFIPFLHPDTLDPALMRPGRLDRKIEIALPNEQGRLDILKIHTRSITTHGTIDYEAIVKLSEGFNGADLRNVCTEAGATSDSFSFSPHFFILGMFAIRAERDYVIQEDFMKAVRKMADAKKLETKLDYEKL